MDHFLYKDGVLHAEDVAIPEIATAVGTPFYVYSSATLTRHFEVFDQALSGMVHLICYAVKANSNQAVLRLLGDLGAGMDVVSLGEYLRARAAGVPGERIVFSGVGKTGAEMREVIAGGIRQFNVESEPELALLSEIAFSMGAEVPIALRVNPDVDARTHEKIATGKSENKFGIPISQARRVYAEAAALPGIRVIGVDVPVVALLRGCFNAVTAARFAGAGLAGAGVAQLGGADRGVVRRVGKENRPAVADPLVKVDVAFCCLRLEIWSLVA